jgi:hypothetical protein
MRRHRSSRLLACLPLLAAAACATSPAFDPFQVAEAEVRSRVRTIALAPLRVSSSLADPSTARAALEPLAVAKLERAGFRVLPSERFDRAWRTAASAAGDVYDRKTGEVNKQRWEAVEDVVYHDLSAHEGVDAILYLSIREEELQLPGREASFCGVRAWLYWHGDLPIFEQPLAATAACLVAMLYDREERLLYGIRSGLLTMDTYAAQTWASRPRAELLADRAALARAIDATLGRLAGDPRKKR